MARLRIGGRAPRGNGINGSGTVTRRLHGNTRLDNLAGVRRLQTSGCRGAAAATKRRRLMAEVLVVEPDRQLRGFIAGILADFGHHVTGCADIEEARNSLRRGRFDVLATDLTLGAKAGGASNWPPQLRLLTLIGYPAGGGTERPPRLCDKPFRFSDLQALVAAVAAGGCGVGVSRR